MTIETTPGPARDPGLLRPGSAAVLILAAFVLLAGLALGSERGSRAYATYQSGLLVLIVFCLALIPARLRLFRRSDSATGYLGSGRFWIDVLLAAAALVCVFVLDLSEIPTKGLRIGVAIAIAFVTALAAAWLGRGKP